MISLPIPSIALSMAVKRNENLALLMILSTRNQPIFLERCIILIAF